MTTINKKVWLEYFEKIISGQKKFDLRLADFEVKEGDTLVLEEWDQDKKEYTGRKTEMVVTYILKTKGQTFWPEIEVTKHGFQIIQFESKKKTVTYEEFKKVEIRAGKILSAEKVPETDKLLKLMVDIGEKNEIGQSTKPLQIISGIAPYYPDPATLVGTTAMFVTNLEPRTIRGLKSQGILLAVSGPDGTFSLLTPSDTIPPGSLAL